MQVYGEPELLQGSTHTLKSDKSPLTLADVRAHQVIVEGLTSLSPEIPIVSEEDESSHAHCHGREKFWLVDPLDGTKEFLARNGQFTVNVAMVRAGQAMFGVVVAPALDEVFWNEPGIGAFGHSAGITSALHVASKSSRMGKPMRVMASRSHLNDATRAFMNGLGKHEVVHAGSSLKFCRIAQGEADCYPRIGATCEWDTAAAQVILEAAGGWVCTLDGERLSYGKASIVNPSFVASAWSLCPNRGSA